MRGRGLTERARLTALYSVLLALSGAALIGVVYLVVRHGLDAQINAAVTKVVPRDGTAQTEPGYTVPPQPRSDGTHDGVQDSATLISAAARAALGRLLTVSLLTLAAFVILSVALAWWMAGRVLRPVRVISATARRLSGENLHERIALSAPPGELKDLADTFDAMLGRMEELVTAQQRFAANAAHELRTPLAVQRAAAEIGLADPDPANVAEIRTKLIETADESERLIEGLLLLSVADQGRLERSEAVALVGVVESVVAGLADEARRYEVSVAVDVHGKPYDVDGDPVLVHHLVHNLVANALRHNRPGGTVSLTLTPAELEVSNTGPLVPPDVVPRLFEPFHRLTERTHQPGEGAGLGLSLVASIARAHGWTLSASANPGGGLTVRVRTGPRW
ncbi:sensor histidine kinase [Streptomyces sp. NBC_01304]|uniref:sensor histidine kinase n=1 Tax=Streptomyces sp. NBC_01304 TaxID=2903818 RepID=UPI002E107810|nr:ATP-binding protein [Streptomyces sp. NBC_01304]